MPKIFAAASPSDRQCAALLYHHVGKAVAGAYAGLTVAPEEFERQIGWLARNGYSGIRPSQWLAWCKSGSELPAKPILITFDDAYADLVMHALPVLRRYGFGAAIFVVTARVGGRSDWDEGLGYSSLPLMSTEQIREWVDQGIEFGAHSRTHTDLTKLSREALPGEITTSRDELGALAGQPVTAFAYPFGAYNNEVVDVVRHSFDLAFSVDNGLNRRQTDLHLLRRNVVKPNQSMWAFSLLVRRGKSWRGILALRTRLRRLRGIDWTRR